MTSFDDLLLRICIMSEEVHEKRTVIFANKEFMRKVAKFQCKTQDSTVNSEIHNLLGIRIVHTPRSAVICDHC